MEGGDVADGAWSLLAPAGGSHVNLWVFREEAVQQGGRGDDALFSGIGK